MQGLKTSDVVRVLLLTALVTSSSCGQQFLTWNHNTEPDLAFYRVYHNEIHLASVGTELFPLTLHGFYHVTAVDTAGNESEPSEAVTYGPISSTPVRVRNLAVNGRGDTVVVALGDSVSVSFELINRLEDGTIIPDSTIHYGVFFRYKGSSSWFQIGALQRADQQGQQVVFLGLKPKDQIEIVVDTFYQGIRSVPAVQTVFLRVLDAAQWKRRTIKVVV